MGLVIVRKLIIAVLLSLALLKKESYRKIMKDTGSSKKGQREKEKNNTKKTEWKKIKRGWIEMRWTETEEKEGVIGRKKNGYEKWKLQ